MKAFISNEEKVKKMKNLVKTLSSNYNKRKLEIKIGICGKETNNLNTDKSQSTISSGGLLLL